MQKTLVKVPFGPVITLHGDEFRAAMRHRTMLFFYFGIVCLILVSAIGRVDPLGKPELVLGLAAIEVLLGIFLICLGKAALTMIANRLGRDVYLHLGWLLVPVVLVVMASGVFLETVLFDATPSPPLEAALKLLFYLVLTELLVSIMLQFTAAGILADLRRDGATDDAPVAVTDGQRPEKAA